MSKINVNTWEPESGTDMTMGASGDTVTTPKLHIQSASAGTIAPSGNADELIVEGSAHAGMSIYSGTTSTGLINFGDDGHDSPGQIIYDHNDNSFKFVTNTGERFRFASSGQLGIAGATYGTAGQVLTSGGAGSAPSWAAGGGLSDASTWRLTSNLTVTNSFTEITANLAEATGTNYGRVGSAMTESGGVFQFPSTGVWVIVFAANGQGESGYTQIFDTRIQTTVDFSTGPTWVDAAVGAHYVGHVQPTTGSITCQFNVTDTAERKCRFAGKRLAAAGGSTMLSSASINVTTFSFYKLGDSV